MKPKVDRFIVEYLKDQNGKQAAIRAGYSGKSAEGQASRLLSNAKVRAAIDAELSDIAKRVGVTVEYVLTGIKEVAERCMQRVPVMVRDGNRMVQKEDAETGEGVWEFDSAGANKSLELLGRYQKMFTDKTETTGKDGGPLIVEQVNYAARKSSV